MKQVIIFMHRACKSLGRKLTYVFVISSFFCACNKGNGCNEADLYSYLTSQQKAIIPFQGGEILTYKSNEGDTLSFRLQAINQRFYKTQKIGEDIACGRTWYLEIGDYTFCCLQDSSRFFQIANRVSTEYSFSILDFSIAGSPRILSEGYNLTHSNHFKDSLLINGQYHKALNLYFMDGGIAGKWVQKFGLAQIFMDSKYYTRCE